MSRSLLRIDDLSRDDAYALIDRARALQHGAAPAVTPFVASLLFLSSSLRTRSGFSAATYRLGGRVIDVFEPRFDATMSSAESVEDTLETLAGISDVLVVRGPLDLGVATTHLGDSVPVMCAGDNDHHPTQALIDWFAIAELVGPPAGLRIALVGDLTMRASRSFLDLAALLGVTGLALVPAPGRLPDPEFSSGHAVIEPSELGDFAPDVVSMIGLPPRRGDRELSTAERAPYILDERLAATLPATCTVLSPMPVIDEIAPETRRNPRVRMFEQNALAVAVRMAALEFVLQPTG